MPRSPILACAALAAFSLAGCFSPELVPCVANGDSQPAIVQVEVRHEPSGVATLDETVHLAASPRTVGQPYPSQCYRPPWPSGETYRVQAWAGNSTSAKTFVVESHVMGVHVEVLQGGAVHVSLSAT